MKFREPLELTCPRCQHTFERSLAWIREEGQQCPQCSASLTSVRDNIEGKITDWTHFVEDAERIMAIEEEFTIAIPDHEAETLRTCGDLHAYLINKVPSNERAEEQPQQIWERLCAVLTTYGETKPTKNSPFVRTDFTPNAT